MNDEKDFFIIRWARFFITRYRISILIMIAILIAGLWGVNNNQRQDFPTIPLNFVIVTSTYPGASPADIEREVIIPIEQAASSLDEVDYVRSSSQNSFAALEVFIKDPDNVEKVAAKLGDEINKLGLPENADTAVQTIDAVGPSVAFGLVSNDGKTSAELLQYAEEVKSRLEISSPDLKRIEVWPDNEFEIRIILDAEQLTKNRLSYDIVKAAVQSQILSLPGGTVKTEEGRQEAITIKSPVQSIDDIKNIPLGRITLGNVAEVKRTPKEDEAVNYIGYVKDGQPFAKEAVYLLAYKNDDGDIIDMSEALHAEIDDIKSAGIVPEDVDIVTGYNLAPFIDDQINSLLKNAYLGLILILVVLLFFINLRTAIVVALVIPIVFLIALFALAVLGFTLNILTLFAMILTLGILIDNAIVIAEGMVHELEKGASRRDAALISVKKLGPAVTAATLTTVVVFIPFASIGGIMGDFLKYIPYTIMIIIIASYLVAISITPLLGRWMLKEQTYDERRAKKIKQWQKMLVLPAIVFYGQNIIDKLSRGYRKLMEIIYGRLKYKIIVLAATAVLLAASFGIFAPQLEFEQMPSKDGDIMQVDVSFPAGTPFEEQKQVFVKIQDEIIKLPNFQTFYMWGNIVTATFAPPKDRQDRKTMFEIVNQYEDKLDVIRQEISQDTIITVQALSYGPPADQYDIIVNFLGTDSEALSSAADDLEKFLLLKPNVTEIKNGPRDVLVPAIEVNLSQSSLAEKKVNPLVATSTINAIFTPQNVGSVVVREDGISDDVTMRFSDASTDSVDDLQNLIIPAEGSGTEQLSHVAAIKKVQNPISIKRLENKRVATVSVTLGELADRAGLDQEIRDYLSEDKLIQLGLPKDGVSYGGEFSAFESDYGKLQIIFLLAMLGVYLILVWQFYSYLQPALIMFAVPLALIGVFPGLLMVGSTLNMISGLGVIALVGIVVNDAIVFISTYNRYRQEFPGDSVSKILVHAGHTRFKPIFSTSITTIGGIIPLTIIDPFWTGLGTSIIAGLIFSTIGTLIAIPVLYSTICGLWSKIRRKDTCDVTPAESAETSE